MIGFSQHDQYTVMRAVLNERQWRLYVATEARRRGTGGISQPAREAGVTRKTIRKGLQELEAGELYEPGGRIRGKGGGRKPITAKDQTLRADLEDLLEPKGDPQSLVRWTTKSMSKLKGSAQEPGTCDWRDRHPGAVKRDGIFPQGQQEGDRGGRAC